MRWHFFIFIAVILSIPAVARAADQLLPASSEDLEQFDKAVTNQQQQNVVPTKKDNFGHAVSKEAHQLKEGNKEDFGKWVSGQHGNHKDNDHDNPAPPDVRSGNGSDNSHGHKRNH